MVVLALGGGASGNFGEIYINGGTVRAFGRNAGIGWGGVNGVGNITINGGDVTANGYVGIGVAQFSAGNYVTINGGTVTSTSNANAGCGIGGFGVDVTINSGIIYASARTGIGGAHSTVVINNGQINVNSTSNIGAAIESSYGALEINGGLLEVTNGNIPSYLGNVDGSISVTGGNLSINPTAIQNGWVDQESYRVQILLDGAPFGNHAGVVYEIDGLPRINAITDSNGDLFMYLPEDIDDREVVMRFNDQWYTGTLSMDSNHGNILLLTLDENFVHPDSIGNGLIIQSGANSGQILTIYIDAMHAQGLGLEDSNGVNVINVLDKSAREISALINPLDAAINKVSLQRASLGAMQNRMEFKMHNLDNQAENVSAAESRIRDADMAREMTEFTRNNILKQSSTAMLAQANALPQSVLQLLG